MGKVSYLVRVNDVAPGAVHDCVGDGQIKMVEQDGIKTFTARQLILPGKTLEIPCENLDVQYLIENKRDDVLSGRLSWMKYEVKPEFWQHPLFDRIPLEPDEHAMVHRAVKFSQVVYKDKICEKNRTGVHWLFPDVASMKHSCDPNCDFNKLQDGAAYGICRLTVLKQMNPDDEITIDWYDGHGQRMARMLEFGDECTSKDCIKCAKRASDSSLSESPAEKRAKF